MTARASSAWTDPSSRAPTRPGEEHAAKPLVQDLAHHAGGLDHQRDLRAARDAREALGRTARRHSWAQAKRDPARLLLRTRSSSPVTRGPRSSTAAAPHLSGKRGYAGVALLALRGKRERDVLHVLHGTQVRARSGVRPSIMLQRSVATTTKSGHSVITLLVTGDPDRGLGRGRRVRRFRGARRGITAQPPCRTWSGASQEEMPGPDDQGHQRSCGTGRPRLVSMGGNNGRWRDLRRHRFRPSSLLTEMHLTAYQLFRRLTYAAPATECDEKQVVRLRGHASSPGAAPHLSEIRGMGACAGTPALHGKRANRSPSGKPSSFAPPRPDHQREHEQASEHDRRTPARYWRSFMRPPLRRRRMRTQRRLNRR